MQICLFISTRVNQWSGGQTRCSYTLVNEYVALPVFTPVDGSSYDHFMEQNGGAQYVNSEFGRYFHFCW